MAVSAVSHPRRFGAATTALVGLGLTVLGFVMVHGFGGVTDVQGASDAASFSTAAFEYGNRVRLALLFDTIVLVPGYFLAVSGCSRWRRRRLVEFTAATPDQTDQPAGIARCLRAAAVIRPRRGKPHRRVRIARRLYAAAAVIVSVAAVADCVENLLAVLGLGTVDLDSAAATLAPAASLVSALEVAAAAKWTSLGIGALCLLIAATADFTGRTERRRHG